MRYDAVIFDLFGALVDNVTPDDYRRTLVEMADVVGADRQAFIDLWRDDEVALKRATGVFAASEQSVQYICERLGVAPGAQRIARAARMRLDAHDQWLAPRPDAVDTLRQLRRLPLKLGLMSVASGDVPLCWPASPLAPFFDEALFSSTIGLTKPDPRFYALACERLGVPPGKCLYVGDGDGNELTGARQAGMHPVLICAPHEEEIVMGRQEARNWRGPKITAPRQVLGLLQ
jgi:putative hydrolase of the HAD superfamily